MDKVAKATRKREKKIRKLQQNEAMMNQNAMASGAAAGELGLFENDEHKGMDKK